MSRPARVLSATGIYHIIFRGMNRQDIFEEDRDFEKLLGRQGTVLCLVN